MTVVLGAVGGLMFALAGVAVIRPVTRPAR
jgi:hypothetical protein